MEDVTIEFSFFDRNCCLLNSPDLEIAVSTMELGVLATLV